MTNSVHQRLILQTAETQSPGSCCWDGRESRRFSLRARPCASRARAPSAAQPWPTAPVHVVVPSPAGRHRRDRARARQAPVHGQGRRQPPRRIRPSSGPRRSRVRADGYTLLLRRTRCSRSTPLVRASPLRPARLRPDHGSPPSISCWSRTPRLQPTALQMIAVARARPGTVSYASYGGKCGAPALRAVAQGDAYRPPARSVQGYRAVRRRGRRGEANLTWAGAPTQAHVRAGRLRAPSRRPRDPPTPASAYLYEFGYRHRLFALVGCSLRRARPPHCSIAFNATSRASSVTGRCASWNCWPRPTSPPTSRQRNSRTGFCASGANGRRS